MSIERDLSRVHTVSATPLSLGIALLSSFQEGGWRHGFTAVDRLIRDGEDVRLIVMSGGRRMSITIREEEGP